jgi:hypothetical protein
MRWTDTHCHLNHPDLYPEWRAALFRAQQSGVERLILVGYDLGEQSPRGRVSRAVGRALRRRRYSPPRRRAVRRRRAGDLAQAGTAAACSCHRRDWAGLLSRPVASRSAVRSLPRADAAGAVAGAARHPTLPRRLRRAARCVGRVSRSARRAALLFGHGDARAARAGAGLLSWGLAA